MPIISINIPQLGEGLQEARLIEFLKKPGDRVERDECIFVMAVSYTHLTLPTKA